MWRIQYSKEMREYAKANEKGLIGIGYMTPDGLRFETMGPAGPKALKYIQRVIRHLQKITD